MPNYTALYYTILITYYAKLYYTVLYYADSCRSCRRF